MVSISDSTLRANVFETIYDVLSAATLNPTSVSIKAAYVDENAGGSFPQIVINSADVDQEDFSFGTGARKSTKTVKVLVDIYTKKNKDRDTLTDGVMSVMNTTSSFPGLCLVEANESIDFSSPNENKIRIKSIALTFMRR